jgi:excisionase family DNA binding protein
MKRTIKRPSEGAHVWRKHSGPRGLYQRSRGSEPHRLHRAILRKLAHENRLRVAKLGRDWLFERKSLLKWKEQMDELGTKNIAQGPRKPTKLESLNLQESRPRLVLENPGPDSEAGTYPPLLVLCQLPPAEAGGL